MPSIQAKTSRGHKYWYIVESRRVNGKPRPIVLAYLGKAEDLLKRLAGLTEGLRLKSYSHGAVAALLEVACALDVAACINRHIHARRSYMAPKPIRKPLDRGHHVRSGCDRPRVHAHQQAGLVELGKNHQLRVFASV